MRVFPRVTRILKCSSLYSTIKLLHVHPHKDQSSYLQVQGKANTISTVYSCGIFKALNADVLKITGEGGESSLCKCEICKYCTLCPCYQCVVSKGWCRSDSSVSGLPHVPSRDRGAGVHWQTPSPAVSEFFWVLWLSGKSRSHCYLAPWGSSSCKGIISTCMQTPWEYLEFHISFSVWPSAKHLTDEFS